MVRPVPLTTLGTVEVLGRGNGSEWQKEEQEGAGGVIRKEKREDVVVVGVKNEGRKKRKK